MRYTQSMDTPHPVRQSMRQSPTQNLGRGVLALLLCLQPLLAQAAAPVISADESPRGRALLEQAWAMESGRGATRSPLLAATLYCMAGTLGSPEAYYRAGNTLLTLPASHRAGERARQLLAQASQMGHAAAAARLQGLGPPRQLFEGCQDDQAVAALRGFNMDRYVNALPPPRRKHALLLRRLAHQYGVQPRLALAVALAESNFHADARSPRDAMGVMQLIPATAARFAVTRPYDPEQNIRGGLAYLRWLQTHFDGDLVQVVAAYNAGEGAVARYGGIPPFAETRDYVLRVLRFADLDLNALPAPGAGPTPTPGKQP